MSRAIRVRPAQPADAQQVLALMLALAKFEGYDAEPTAEGVSGATTRTVVTSSLAILAADFILTALMFRGA